MSRPGLAPLALGGAAVAGAGLAAWTCMSSYSQLLGQFPYRGIVDDRAIALTFDDGPNEPFTSLLADFLHSRGVRATFFQVGRAVMNYPEVTQRLVRDGHVIGNHGLTHEFTNYLTLEAVAAEVRGGQAALASAGLAGAGLRPALYRPPWLLRVPALFDVLGSHGLRAVSGEFCHAFEVCQPSPARIARRALAKASPGSMIIFHDGYDGHPGERGNTVAAVEIVVDRLIADGYRFVTVDELLGIPAYL